MKRFESFLFDQELNDIMHDEKRKEEIKYKHSADGPHEKFVDMCDVL